MKCYKKLLTISIIALSIYAPTTYTHKTIELRNLKDFSDGTIDPSGFKYLKDMFNLNTIIETGTYSGVSSLKFSYLFDHVYTVELSEPLYNESKNRLAHRKNVSIFHDSSPLFLQTKIPNQLDNTLIFLDAHGCGGLTAPDYPLFRELDVLKTINAQKAVILIDDARGFSRTGENSFEKIIAQLKEINHNFVIVSYGDTLLAYDDPTIIPSTILHACTKILLFDEKIDKVQDIMEIELIIARAKDTEKAALLRLTFPESALYHVWRGLIHMHEEKYDHAKNLFDAATQKGFDHWRVHFYSAQANDHETI